ncbi:ATP-binding protein [Paraburkholderia sediminicola]
MQRCCNFPFNRRRTLDFKEELDLSRDGRQALAEDVCAFANTVGGDLVFGMREVGGMAAEVIPLDIADIDAQLLTLTNFLRDAVEPRVTTALLSHAVPLASGGHVVVLRVSASPNAPHRVIRSGQFYLRNSVGKEPMDIHAIRTAFAFADGLADRALAFRDRRLALLDEGFAQVRVPPLRPRIVVHAAPVLALTRRDTHTVEELKAAALYLQRASRCARPRLTTKASSAQPVRTANAYAQLFRDGSIELVGLLSTGDVEQPPAPTIYPAQHELPLVQHGIPMIAQALATLGVPAPVYLFVSLHRRGATYVTVCRPRTRHAENRPLPPHLTDLLSPPVYVEDLGVPAAQLMAPALDPLWNAVGIDHTQTNFAGGGV